MFTDYGILPRKQHGTMQTPAQTNSEGNPKLGCKCTRKCTNCANGSIRRLCMVVLSIFMHRKYFSILNQNSSRYSHTGWLFTNDKLKKVDSWCNAHSCHICQPCSWCHITRRPDTKWRSSRPCFYDFHMLILNKVDCKLTEKLLRV